MARLKLVLALFALMILTAGVAGAAYYWQKYVRPQQEVKHQMAGRAEAKPDLGRKHYLKAIEYIKEGELISARDVLQYMLDIYPESPTIDEAKRVLGEINLDLMISKIPIDGKDEYKVRSGDALVTIAKRYKTTIDYIMRANAKTTTLIYPNEDLTVLPLGCDADIDLKNATLTVKEGERFIKQYNILEHHLPARFPTTVSTSISEKVAWYEGRSVNFMSPNYFRSQKWIRTGKMGLFILQHGDEEKMEDDANKTYGVMVAKADMDELFTILRGGSIIRVVAAE